MDIGEQGFTGPCGIDFAGGDVFDIVDEADSHITGIGGGGSEVDGDIIGDKNIV